MRLILTFILFSFLSFNVLFAQKAPDFKLLTTDKSEITLYEDFLNQGKSVVIELFFVDCPPCNTLAPFLKDLHDKMLNQKIAVEFISLSVSSSDNDEDVAGFKERYSHDWPFVSPDGGSLDAANIYQDNTFGAYWGTPTTIVIAPDGSVNYNVRDAIGTPWRDKLEAAILDSQTALNDNDEPATAIVSGGIRTAGGSGIGGVTLQFSGGSDTTLITGSDGSFSSAGLLAQEQYTVVPEKNTNAVNGVTTLDIVLISRHILNIESFSEPHQLIAADVNGSGAITTFDLVQMRQVILGLIDQFPNNPSWVFDPPELILDSLTNLGALAFTGIKIGDLNGSAITDEFLAAEERGETTPYSLYTENRYLEQGTIARVDLRSNDLSLISGFQFTIDFDEQSLQFTQLIRGDLPGLTEDNFNFSRMQQGMLSTSWFSHDLLYGSSLFSLEFEVTKSGYLSDFLKINSALTKAEIYTVDDKVRDISLLFKEKGKKMDITSSRIFPNPTKKSIVNLTGFLTEPNSVFVKVTDLTGKQIGQYPYDLAVGSFHLAIPLPSLEKGLYFVQLFQKKELVKTHKLIVD